MMIQRMRILLRLIRMFLKGIVRESFSRVMEPTNGIGIWEVTDGNLQITPISMRFLVTK